MVGIKEIAEALGLSRHTVSDILNCNDQRYSAKTRERVRAMAEKMGYRPNRIAQSLRRKRTQTIGVICFNSMHELSEMRMQNVLREIHATPYHPVVVNCNWHEKGKREAFDQMIELRVSGILMIDPSFTDEEARLFPEMLAQRNIPFVGLGGAKYPGYPRFMSDKRYGFYQITRHLIEQGYTRITLMLRGRPDPERKSWHSRMGILGYRECMQHYGLGANEDIFLLGAQPGGLCLTSEYVGDPYIPGYESMLQVLQRKELPEAVICANDSWAYGALRACREHGIRVPDDMAVCGFEDELSSRYGILPLTTFRQPLAELARRAVTHLLYLIENEMMGEDRIESIPGELIVRDSSINRRMIREVAR